MRSGFSGSVGYEIRTQNHHHRRSIRLKGYNYTQPGAYFVTICTKNRACLVGEAVDGKMLLNDAGRMVQTVWDEMPVHYVGVAINTFVVMPNHIHGIVVLVGAAPVAALLWGRHRGLPLQLGYRCRM